MGIAAYVPFVFSGQFLIVSIPVLSFVGGGFAAWEFRRHPKQAIAIFFASAILIFWVGSGGSLAWFP